ncbi:MAG TPA: peptidylprolyl isomerase [Granulicella sp.]|nr:peptidylprolyl isomerase [Granulicella sp.]
MRFAVMTGAVLLSAAQMATAQAPQYQSPINEPTPQVTLPVSPAITPNGVVVEDVIARVNDQIISRSDLARAEQQLMQDGQQAGATQAQLESRQKDLLRDLIDQQLLLSRGKQLGINADAEVIRRLDEIRKQNHLDTMEDLEKAAQQQGVSFEDFKANIRNTLITQQVVRDEVGRHLQMTPAQEQAYYEAHKQEYAQPEQIRLSEILVPTPADASEAVVAQAQAKADGIEKQLKAGDKFDALAKQVSGGPTAAQGGDLGLFKHGGLAKVLEDQTFDLKAGQFTAPIRTRQGFVILEVTEHEDAGIPPLKTIEPQIEQAMYTEEMQPALRTYLTKLREDAYIDIKPGFVDSGASSKQTKPVFTAYSAPLSKKEKKAAKRKNRFNRGGVVKAAAVAPAAEAKPAVIKLDKHGKPKKVKREKIRFGQAPEQALPPGPMTATTGTDKGAGSAQAAGSGATLAPGTTTDNNPLSVGEDTNAADPMAMAAKPAPTKKTRYAARAQFVKAKKIKAKKAKAADKVAATPTAMTAEEKAAQKVQAAPLGLNGDMAKKKTKKKRAKGQAKERLQPKPKDTSTIPQKNPDGTYPTPYHPADQNKPATPAPAPAPSAPPATTNPNPTPPSA